LKNQYFGVIIYAIFEHDFFNILTTKMYNIITYYCSPIVIDQLSCIQHVMNHFSSWNSKGQTMAFTIYIIIYNYITLKKMIFSTWKYENIDEDP
jgi:hypothetical protein